MARVFSMSAASSPSSRLVAISRASARKRLFWVSQLSASLSELAEKQAPSSRRNRSPALRPSFEGKMMRASSRQQCQLSSKTMATGAGKLIVSAVAFEKDRKSVVEGKRVSVSVDLGGGRNLQKKKN